MLGDREVRWLGEAERLLEAHGSSGSRARGARGGIERRSSGPRLQDWVDRGEEEVGPVLKTRGLVVSAGWSGWIWEDPDGDGEWVAAAETREMDGTSRTRV